MNNVEYNNCLVGRYSTAHINFLVLTRIGINRDLITATAAIAGIGSCAFGFFTNLPVALA